MSKHTRFRIPGLGTVFRSNDAQNPKAIYMLCSYFERVVRLPDLIKLRTFHATDPVGAVSPSERILLHVLSRPQRNLGYSILQVVPLITAHRASRGCVNYCLNFELTSDPGRIGSPTCDDRARRIMAERWGHNEDDQSPVINGSESWRPSKPK